MNERDISPEHLDAIVSHILEGRLIPFFGAGVNLCGSPSPPGTWEAASSLRLPNGGELSRHLATKFKYPEKDVEELARVSQFAGAFYGPGRLYEELHELFSRPFEPTPLHRFFAKLPRACRENGYPEGTDATKKHLLIVTTNYDDLMERAFKEIDQPFHVLTYLSDSATPDDLPVFLHRPPNAGGPRVIEENNRYEGLNADAFPVLLKIHGAVAQTDEAREKPHYESFVITEDHYIEYISRRDITASIPMSMQSQLLVSNFLFLGYALRDWNLRALLVRIWRQQGRRGTKPWAVNKQFSPLEETYLPSKNIGIVEADLGDYIAELDKLFNERVKR